MSNDEFRFPICREEQTVFPSEYEKQLAALKNDPGYLEMKRLRAERLKNDRHFPVYHYTAAVGGINDPNGPCFWRGRWHLFYQQFYGGRVIWGHAVSPDLAVWDELPFALCPDTEEGCWSGAIHCDEDKAVALWYGHSNNNGGGCGLYIATSSDDLLLNWTRITDGPTIPSADNPIDEGESEEIPFESVPYTRQPMLYDPCIWREGKTYFALSAGVHKNRYTGGLRREEYLFSSENLTDWKFEHPFIADESYSDTGDDGGCPYFLPIGDRHMLLHYSHKYGARYVLGNYDKTRRIFSPTSGERLNTVTQTAGYCAPAAWRVPDGSGDDFAIYVMHGTKGPALMSLPHRLKLCGKCGDQLAVSSAASLEKLREKHVRLEKSIVGKGETVFDEISGGSLELDVTLEYDGDCSPELRFFRSEDGEEYTSLKLYPGCGSKYKDGRDWFPSTTVVLDPSRSCQNGKATPPDTIELPSNRPIRLKIFLDRSVIEVFGAGDESGRSIGRRVFPSESGVGISAVCDTGSLKITADCYTIGEASWRITDMIN